MSTTDERIQAESVTQREIRNRLEPLVALLERADSLNERALRAIALYPRPGAAAKVGCILTSRLGNDLRVCGLVAQLGYGLQALGLAASMLELVGVLSYVSDDDNRAENWARHSDLRKAYPRRVEEGIEAALKCLGIADPAAKENWTQAYSFMCMAKHANPRLSLIHGLRIFPSGVYHVCGPDASALGTYLSAEALHYAVGFGSQGVYIALNHCLDESLRTQLQTEALNMLQDRHGLESWFLGVKHDYETAESHPDLNGEEETMALLSDADLLRSETERLQSESRRLKKEKKRIHRNRPRRGSPAAH